MQLQPRHRCLSDPINTIGTQVSEAPNTQLYGSFAALCQVLNAQSPETSKNVIGSSSKSPSPATTTSLPPLPPAIYRTLSDPTSASYQLVDATTPPPLSQAARTCRRSPSADESPNTKRLKRIKERMREMGQWWDQVMHEEDEDVGSEGGNIDNNPKDEAENEPKEAVWVEKRNGDGLIIHFKCPCGEGYEIFLWGNNCYYKLM